MTGLAGCLLVSSILFAVGLAGALTRRNTILVLVGIELMLNAANLNFVAFWRFGPHASGVSTGMILEFSPSRSRRQKRRLDWHSSSRFIDTRRLPI